MESCNPPSEPELPNGPLRQPVTSSRIGPGNLQQERERQGPYFLKFEEEGGGGDSVTGLLSK